MQHIVDAFLQSHQTAIYTVLFFATFCGVAVWESVAPLRPLGSPLPTRWRSNLGIMLVNTLLIWAVYPGAGVGAALVSSEANWGLMRLFDVPYWWSFVASIFVLDFFRYAEHFLLHYIPILWRVHRTHHTDQDFDVTTAVRFHPLEAVGVIGMKVATVALIGPPVAAVLLYELAYPMTTFWVHANVKTPRKAERLMRSIFITPDMHRAHHSVVSSELNSNFGGLFSFWDRLLGTYTHEPAAGHLGMQIGVPEFEDPRHLTLSWMLINPLLSSGRRAAAAGEVATTSSEASR